MQPYQERVVTEKNELDEKLSKLKAFTRTDAFAKIDSDEAALLMIQLGAMQLYSNTLGDRIAAFTG